jgi:hypothetical protein
MSDRVRARYVDGRACIELGDRPLWVDRRDNDTRESGCPLELVSAALGA